MGEEGRGKDGKFSPYLGECNYRKVEGGVCD